jgi:hypothetical protein
MVVDKSRGERMFLRWSSWLVRRWPTRSHSRPTDGKKVLVGEPCVAQLGSNPVDGEAVRTLITSTGCRSIRVVGGRIATPLDLSAVVINVPVEFKGTTFEEPIDLSGATLHQLRLVQCTVRRGINANGVTVAGDLNLDGSTISGALVTAASATRRAAVWLSEARIGGRLLASGTTITALQTEGEARARALQADRVSVGGNVRLIRGFRAEGEVRFIGAGIGGSLDLTSCSLYDTDLALDLGEATIGGSLFLLPDHYGQQPEIEGRVDMGHVLVNGQTLIKGTSFSAPTATASPPVYYRFDPFDHQVAIQAAGATFRGLFSMVEGCRIEGLIDLRGATFGHQLDLGDTSLHANDGYSIDLAAARISGDLTLARHSRSIRLANAAIEGSVMGNGAAIQASEEDAVMARGLNVGGDIVFDAVATSNGGINLRRAHIAGDLNLGGAELSHPAGLSLALSSAHIEGSAYFTDAFRSEGTVSLRRATIGGRLVCDGGTFVAGVIDGDRVSAVDAELLTARAGIFLSWTVHGPVDLTGATTTVLSDHPDGWGDAYRIGGLTYDRFGAETGTAVDTTARIDWLLRQTRLDASSFEQLATYYRRRGQTVDAEHVLIARNRALRVRRAESGGWRNRVRNGLDRVWDLSVGYGYRAGRAGGLLLLLVVTTAAALSLPAATGTMRTTDEDNTVFSPQGPLGSPEAPSGACGGGRVRCFQPVFYALDTVVPLIDLHQRSTWRPDRAASYGRHYEWGLNIAVLLGWASSSALVLGLTHAIGPGRR